MLYNDSRSITIIENRIYVAVLKQFYRLPDIQYDFIYLTSKIQSQLECNKINVATTNANTSKAMLLF